MEIQNSSIGWNNHCGDTIFSAIPFMSLEVRGTVLP